MRQGLADAGGWWSFERYMEAALYTPGLGYYSGGRIKLGLGPQDGSDFATAPEMSPLFGRCLARQVAQALECTNTQMVVEFGAGSGALAAQLLEALGDRVQRYAIVDLSGSLRERQQARLAPWGHRVEWWDHWPDSVEAVVVANELLDAMPVRLLHWDGRQWWERGVTLDAAGSWQWDDRPTTDRPPIEGRSLTAQDDAEADWTRRFAPGTVLEVHPQAQAYMATLARSLHRGAAFFIDYGFPEREYYHPQRTGGTLMCHHGHRSDPDPLSLPGEKDITSHVNFTAMALAAQDGGLEVLGYTSQAHFLFNCGAVEALEQLGPLQRGQAARLLHEHEMGELFKVLAVATAPGFEAMGFVRGDRSHTL